MNFLPQSGTRDCFPTCFRNAMLYFGVAVSPAVQQRLEAFRNGTESCTIHDPEERLELYERSIHKFMAEWNGALAYKNDTEGIYSQPGEWAQYLLEKGIELEVRNGPIEQKELIADSLSQGKLVICEIWVPSTDIPESESRHFVLLVKSVKGRLLVHDPLSKHGNLCSGSVEYKKNGCGANGEIESGYFFSKEIGPMKPKPNPYQSDYGYKCMLVAKRPG
jgi:hypothetical protein